MTALLIDGYEHIRSIPPSESNKAALALRSTAPRLSGLVMYMKKMILDVVRNAIFTRLSLLFQILLVERGNGSIDRMASMTTARHLVTKHAY